MSTSRCGYVINVRGKYLNANGAASADIDEAVRFASREEATAHAVKEWGEQWNEGATGAWTGIRIEIEHDWQDGGSDGRAEYEHCAGCGYTKRHPNY